MGLTEAEKRKRTVATQEIVTFDSAGEDDYVFISYKSDDWEIVLDKVVRYMVENYGLRVYFDKNFERDNDSWVENMRNAISTRKCKAILAFVSRKYMVSYACMMELLTARNKLTYMFHKDSDKKLPIIPIIVDDSGSIKGAGTNSGKLVVINEWDEYNKLLKDTIESPWVKKDADLKECLVLLQNQKERRLKEEMISIVVERIIGNEYQRTFTEYTYDTAFFDNLRMTIKNCSETVFDTKLIKKETAASEDADTAIGRTVEKSTVNPGEKADVGKADREKTGNGTRNIQPQESGTEADGDWRQESIATFSKTFKSLAQTTALAQGRIADIRFVLPKEAYAGTKLSINWDGYLKNVPKQMVENLHAETEGRFTEYLYRNQAVRTEGSSSLLLAREKEELNGRTAGESASLWKEMNNASYYIYQGYGHMDAIRAIKHVCNLYFQYLREEERRSTGFSAEDVRIEYKLKSQ